MVTEAINNDNKTGKIKINGYTYNAVSTDRLKVYEIGVIVRISEYNDLDESFICEVPDSE
jgi:hypothetical protein